MKILLPIMFIFITACSSSTNDLKLTKIEFDKLKFDFNEIKLNDSVECSFKFINVGNSQLTINKVKPSCGCTVPEWTKEPIDINKRGIIKVKYSSTYPKKFYESIIVYYNGMDSPVTLHIYGIVR